MQEAEVNHEIALTTYAPSEIVMLGLRKTAYKNFNPRGANLLAKAV
jgi:hypothetical protein